MYPARDLYAVVVPPADQTAGNVASDIFLIHDLTRFRDAGGGRLAVAHMLETIENSPVAYLHIDSLYDYSGSRPKTIINTDHYESMELPHITLSVINDSEGQTFLLLHGVEPDLGWQSVVAKFDDRKALIFLHLEVM